MSAPEPEASLGVCTKWVLLAEITSGGGGGGGLPGWQTILQTLIPEEGLPHPKATCRKEGLTRWALAGPCSSLGKACFGLYYKGVVQPFSF